MIISLAFGIRVKICKEKRNKSTFATSEGFQRRFCSKGISAALHDKRKTSIDVFLSFLLCGASVHKENAQRKQYLERLSKYSCGNRTQETQ
jgi:hypothetical protein